MNQLSEALSANILRLVLPEELFEYFDIESLVEESKKVHVYLVEINTKPICNNTEKLISKGFYDSVTIQDFPLRRKALYLHIKRRKWVNQDTGAVISREWKLVAQGTRYTQSFADFLKGLLGYLPHKFE